MQSTLDEQIGVCCRSPEAPILVVKAVDGGTGVPVTFDNRVAPVRPVHLKASASIPLLFPATRIDGHIYWDGDFTRHSVLDDVIEVAAAEGVDDGQLLGIVIEPFPYRADVPPTTLGFSFALLGGLLSGKGLEDQRHHAARMVHSDFIRRATALVADDAESPVAELVRDAQRRLQREPNVTVIRIARSAGPYDHISRDLDYSPERISALMEQGEAEARKALAAFPCGTISPSTVQQSTAA